MNRDQKRKYNEANEIDYHYAPFTEARRELREQWNGTRKDWNHFLYEAERKYQHI